MSTEAMKLALEALEGIHPGNMTPMAEEYWNKAITALQEALAQPQQEPSGWQKIECPICGDMAIATDIPAAQPQQEPVAAVAWQQGYDQGVADERISEANIGIAGFNAKVNPARNNPYTSPQPAPVQQEPVAWVDAGDLKPFRYCGVLEECDYEYYRKNNQFVYLEVGMATVGKIVYTKKDFTTGAVYADRGYRVEVARVLEQPAPVAEPRKQEPVAGLLVGQDSDGRYVSIAAKAHADTLPLGEYKLYTSPPAQRKPLTDEEMDNRLRRAGIIATLEALRCIGREVEAAHGIKGDA